MFKYNIQFCRKKCYGKHVWQENSTIKYYTLPVERDSKNSPEKKMIQQNIQVHLRNSSALCFAKKIRKEDSV